MVVAREALTRVSRASVPALALWCGMVRACARGAAEAVGAEGLGRGSALGTAPAVGVLWLRVTCMRLYPVTGAELCSGGWGSEAVSSEASRLSQCATGK